MRKFDNSEFFVSVGLGSGCAIGLVAFAASLNPILAIQAFVGTFGAIMLGYFGITTIVQFSTRDDEAEVEKQERLTKRISLIERANAIDIYTSRMARLEQRVDEKLAAAEDKTAERIEGLADDATAKFANDGATSK